MSATVPERLAGRAAEEPSACAVLVDGVGTLRFGEWDQRSNRLARGLSALGVDAGERVLLLFDERRWVDYAVAYVGVLKAGAVAVPVSSRLAPSELRHIAIHAAASAVISPPDLASSGSGWGLSASLVTPEELERGQSPDAFRRSVAGDDLAEVLYTSGTTGLPKGVACSHSSILVGTLSDLPADGATSTYFLHATPVGTIAGQETLRAVLAPGRRCAVVLPVFDPERACELIEQLRVRRLHLVPAAAHVLARSDAPANHDVSSLDRIVLGGAASSPALLHRLVDLFPTAEVHNVYSLTEAGGARTRMIHGRGRGGSAREASVGRPEAGSEVRIVDERGEPLPPGEAGEIWLRRPGAPTRSYYRDLEASARAFAGGWLHTGDLGYLDEEGYLYLVDRMNDLVITGGFNVSTIEVESVLEEHPAVVEAAVFGVPHDVLGHDVAAAVVLRAPVEGRVLQAFARERLAEYKTPHRVMVVESLPRTGTGKVVKRVLQERLLAESRARPVEGAAATEAAAGTEEVVAAIWAEILQADGVAAEDDFFALGGHSLAAAQVISRLQDTFGVTLSLEALLTSPTVAECAVMVDDARTVSAGGRVPE